MDVSALWLLLYSVLNWLYSGSAQVSVAVSPERTQFFKYEGFFVRCEDEDDEDGDITGWTVMKRMGDGEVHQCSPCSVLAAFPFTDSGEYWCQSEQGDTSNSISITVTAGRVILNSPVHPVMEGDDVSLSCRYIFIQTPSSAPSTEFSKDGVLIGRSNTGNMTLYSVSRSDEGLYKCKIVGSESESQGSWLTVRGQDHSTVLPSGSWLFILVRRLVVGCPYLVTTILLGLVCRERRKARHLRRRRRRRQKCDDVIMEMVHYDVGHHR